VKLSGFIIQFLDCHEPEPNSETWPDPDTTGYPVEMGQMSDYDILPKPKVWAGSPNECRTFSRMLFARIKQRVLLVIGQRIERPGNVVLVSST